MRKRWTKLAVVAAAPVLLGGWALFRPELLFVDQKVDAKIVTTKAETLAKGSFDSYAHETSGQAEILASAGKRFLRLSGFKTSNGPDVHVYLVKGTDSSGEGVKRGFIDLGSLKGNIGDQDYELPSQADPNEYMAVAIWCKRFSVDFGGATLSGGAHKRQASLPIHLAVFDPGKEIRVTAGKFSGGGKAELIEKDGLRFLRVTGARMGSHVLLVKAETLHGDAEITRSKKLDLGTIKSASPQLLPVPKEIDAWLYRTVALWSPKTKKSTGIAELRSDQERTGSMLLA